VKPLTLVGEIHSLKESEREVKGMDIKMKNLKTVCKSEPVKNPAASQEGATLIEIALYVALVVIVCIAVVTTLGDKLQGVFQTIVNSI